ncbi:MAG TPA: ABC transporter permease [Bryobacteraceae bacterium]|nr:ABC transporter permease [Bryobacteraceae bacterium]
MRVLRQLLRTPAFSLAAVAALALGIGANSAIFSVIDAVLLKPLAYPDPDRIVEFLLTSPAGINAGSSATRFNVWRQQTAVFEDVAAYEYSARGLNLSGGAHPEQIRAIRVSAAYFHLLGAPIAVGRTFSADEDRPAGALAAVISHGLWQRRFASDPAIIGRAIELSGSAYQVVGIMGPGFNTGLDPEPEVWLPFQLDPESTDHAQYFASIARLKPGVTLAMANAQLQLAAAEFRRKFPSIMGPHDGFLVETLPEALVSDVRPALLVLSGAVGLVLLIACANVANLLLVRATGRKREIAIRAALGASRGVIIRQLLVESAVLSLSGGAIGLVLGLAGVRALLAVNPGDIPRIGAQGAGVSLDWRVLAFTIAVSLATGILFGLLPALDVSRTDLTTALKEGGRSGTGRRQQRTRSCLVVGEVAIALVLLVGASLLIRTFLALRAVDAGFDAHNVLTLRMSLAGSRFRGTDGVNRLIRDGVQRIESVPGVIRAGASFTLPLEGGFGIPYNIVGRPAPNGAYDGRGWTAASPGYFALFRIPVVRGRSFTERDDGGAPRVAIINQAMARRFWPDYPQGRDPLDDRVILGKGYGPEFEEPARQIVGIVGDVHDSGLNRSPAPMVYVPMAQVTDGITSLATRASSIAWIVRTRVTPHELRPAIQNELEQTAGGLPVEDVRSMEEIRAQSTARDDFNMSLLTIFGATALVLAAIGIYGLMAYTVQQRTREIGIRLALGAEPGGVGAMVVWQGLRLAGAGIAIGMGAALGMVRLLSAFLFGVKAQDPLAFLAAPVVLSAVAVAAIWFPARRASRTDPLLALRSE